MDEDLLRYTVLRQKTNCFFAARAIFHYFYVETRNLLIIGYLKTQEKFQLLRIQRKLDKGEGESIMNVSRCIKKIKGEKNVNVAQEEGGNLFSAMVCFVADYVNNSPSRARAV